jgi:CDP-diacylglycerol--serine O-phosphatidyltransferase
LIDIVSFGVCPALVLLSYGNYDIWFVPGAFIIVAAGVLRLSYFNVFGLIGKSTYQGLAIDNNGILLVLLFFLEGFISISLFTALLYASIVLLAALNVAPIKTPKLSADGWYYGIAAYAVVASLFYVWRLMQTVS